MNKEHHVQQEFCKTRPLYRQGKKLTATKVYTVNNESSHLYVYGVPKIKLRSEIKSLFMKYGHIKQLHVVTDVEAEPFTECYHIHFDRIQSARIAKRLTDNKNFYGGILHVCYTPEHESVEDARKKLQQRFIDVLSRLKKQEQNNVSRGLKRDQDESNSNYLNEVETNYDTRQFVMKRRKRLKLK